MSDDQPKGAPDWVVTFTDMMGLLLTFFILLLTFSTLEEDKFARAVGSIQGAFRAVTIDVDCPSILRRGQRPAPTQGMTVPSGEEETETPLKRVAIRLKDSFGEAMDCDLLAKGYRIRIAADTHFQPGSAELTAACRRTLEAIAKAVAGLPNPIRVDGHTDDRFQASPAFPSASHLAAARATAAARCLVEAGPIDPRRLSVAAYGAARPAVPSSSEAARARNRRIEITILSLLPQGK